MVLIRLYSSRSSFKERRLRNDFSSSSLIRLSSRYSFSRLGRFLGDRNILSSNIIFRKSVLQILEINKLSNVLLNNFGFPFKKNVHLKNIPNISKLKHFFHTFTLFTSYTFYRYFVLDIKNHSWNWLLVFLELYQRSCNVGR